MKNATCSWELCLRQVEFAFSAKSTDQWVENMDVMCNFHQGIWQHVGVCMHVDEFRYLCLAQMHMGIYVCMRMFTCLALQIQPLCIYSTCVHVCMTLPVPVHVGVYWVSRCTRGWWRSPGRTGRGVW